MSIGVRVMMEHCFKEEGKQEITKKEEYTKMASLYLQGEKKELHERQDKVKATTTGG